MPTCRMAEEPDPGMPARCLACGAPGHGLCPDCREAFAGEPVPAAPGLELED